MVPRNWDAEPDDYFEPSASALKDKVERLTAENEQLKAQLRRAFEAGYSAQTDDDGVWSFDMRWAGDAMITERTVMGEAFTSFQQQAGQPQEPQR